MLELTYEVVLANQHRAIVKGEAIAKAWGASLPALASQLLDIPVGRTVLVFRDPQIAVRRLC